MARALVVLLFAAALLAAGAGLAEAKKEQKPAPDVPAHAKAHGLAKRYAAPAAPAPAPHEAPAAAQDDAPRGSAPAKREPAPAAAPEPEPQEAPGEAAVEDPGAAAVALPAEPGPLARDEGVALAGAGIALGPGFAPGFAAPESAEPGSPARWWLTLLWALPSLGVGGAGTVLLLRRKGALFAHATPKPAMEPVEPTDLPGLLRNGRAAVARGAIDEAVGWFDAALRLAPSLAVAHFCKGVCLAAAGRVAEAYAALDEAVYAAPEETTYQIHFARAALALGRPGEALDALAHVTQAMPDLGPAMLEDPHLAALRDDPRFLMMCGAL